PDDIDPKKTAGQDLGRLRKWVFPMLEHVPLKDVTLAMARDVLKAIPPTKSRATRKHVGQAISKVMKLALNPGELIEQNPIPPGFGGRKGPQKAKSHLYPNEDNQLLGCAEVPLENRFFYGLLAREGLRSDEAQSLELKDLDLDRGTITLDVNKT